MKKMRKSRKIMIISVVVAVIILLSSFAIYATIHDAAGGGGSSGSLPGDTNSVTGDFANTSDYPIAGLRLSIVNVNTGQTKGTNRDIVSHTDSMYNNRQMFSEKYNKVQMKNNYTGSFHLMNTTDSYSSLYYADSNNKGMWDITPYRSGNIQDWERIDKNLQAAASYILYGDGSHKYDSLTTLLAPGDRIVIEALYPIKVDGKGYFMTCSEYATFYAQRYAGSAYDSAFTNSGNRGSPFYIGKTLGRYLPSGMFAPDGSLENCGIGRAASLAGQATYRQLITQGYGMHVAYTDNRPPAPTTCNLEVLERFAVLRKDASGNYWVDYEYAPGDNTGKQIYQKNYTVAKGSTIRVGNYSTSIPLAGNANGDFPTLYFPEEISGSIPWSYKANRWWTSDGSAVGSNMSDTFTINSDKTLVITYLPDKARFTVNEYFDMVYDDGYTVESRFHPGEIGIKENRLVHTNTYEVDPFANVSIGDYIRPKTENNRTDGKWIDFPSTPYTDKDWAEYNYVGSGKTFKTKWNYHFDNSYKKNSSAPSSNDMNKKYLIDTNGVIAGNIVINVHYKPDDVDMNLSTVYKKYNPATHRTSSYTLSRDKNQYYPMTYMNINDSGYLKRPDAFTQDGETAGTVGNPYYFLTYTQWKSEGYKEASEEVYQNKCWYGYTYSADNKDGENTKYENGKLDFLMCKKINNIDAVYEANLAKYKIEYYQNNRLKKTLTDIYYQPEGEFYGFKQEGENFDAKRYFLSPSEFNAEYKMSVDENATIDYAVIERTVDGNKTVERINKDSLWKVTMNDNNAVIRIYYNEPAELTVNHYVDGELKFSDNKICRSGRIFTANLPAPFTVIGETVDISKDFVKTPNFFIDNYDVYAVIKSAKYGYDYYEESEKEAASDINNFSITFDSDDNIVVDLYYETPKINATVEYYLNEDATPFATETFNPKGYIEFDGKYGQEGDLISASNFIFTSDALNEKYGDNIKNMPGRYNKKARPDTVVEAISYSTTGGDTKKVIGRDNVKGNDANYKINSMDDLTIKVYYCEPIELTVSYWVDGQQIASKLTKEYLPSSRVLNIDGESVTIQGINYTLEKYAENTKGLSDVGVKLDSFSSTNDKSKGKYEPNEIKTEFSTSNRDEQANLHYSTSVGLTVVFNVFNTETQEYEKFFEYTYENDFKKNTKFDKDTLNAVMNGANTKLTGTKFDTFLGVQNAQLKMNENNLIGGFSATHKDDNQKDITNTYQLDSANFNKSTTLALTGDKTDATITDDSLNRMVMQYATNTLELYYDAPFKRVTFNYNYLTFDKDDVSEKGFEPYNESDKTGGINWREDFWSSYNKQTGEYLENNTTNYALKYHDYAEKVITVTDTIKVHVDENYTINKEKPEHESHKKVFNGEVWWEKDAATKYHIPYDTPCDFQSDLYLKTDYSGENGSEKTVACSVSENNPSLPDSFSYDALNSNTTYDFYYKPTQYKVVYDKNSIGAIIQGVDNEDKNAVKEKTEFWQKTGENIKLSETLFANFGENLNGWTACDLNTGLWYGYRDYGSVVELGWHKYSDLIKNVNDAKYESYKGKITKDGCYLFGPTEETNFSNAKTWGTLKFYAQWGEEDKTGKLPVYFTMNSTPTKKSSSSSGYSNKGIVGTVGNEIGNYSKSTPMNVQYLSADKDNYLRTNTFVREGYDFIGWKLQLVKNNGKQLSHSEKKDTSNPMYQNTVYSDNWSKVWTFISNKKPQSYWRAENECKNGILSSFDPFISTCSAYGSNDSFGSLSTDFGGMLVDDNGFVNLKSGMINSSDYDKYYIIAYAQWKESTPKFTVVFQDAAERPAWNDSNKHLVSIKYETTKAKTFGFEDTYDTTSTHFTSQGFAKYGKIASDNLKIRLYNLEENYEVDENNSWRDNTNNYAEIGIKYNGEAKENKPIVKLWNNGNKAEGKLNSDTWARYSAEIVNGNKIIVTLYANYNIKYDRNQGQGEDDIFNTDRPNNFLDISKDYTVLGYGAVPDTNNKTFTTLMPEKYVGCEKYRVYRDARKGFIYIPEEDSWDIGLVETDVKRYLAYNGDKLDWYTEDEIAKNNYKYYYIKSGNNFGPETINGVNSFNYLVHKGDTVYFEAQWQAKVNIQFVTAEGAEPFVKDDKVWNSMLSVVNTQNPTVAISTVGIKKAEDVYFNGTNGYFDTDEDYIAKILLSNKNDGTPISDNNSNMLSFEYNPATGASEYPDQLYGKELRLKDNERWSHYSIEVAKKDKEADLVTVTLYDKYYNIEYDANGGRNTMQGQKAISGEQITLNKNLFERDNFSYRFWYASYQDGGNTYWYGYKGNATEPSWQLEKDLTRKYAFSDEEKVVFNFTNKVTVTMHAQWAADFTVEYVDENGNPAFDSWNNKVSYSCDENGTYKWLSTTTKSTSSYYPLDVINKDTAQTEMKVSAALGHSSAISSSYTDFIFKYKINEGVMKADNVQYDKIVLINQNGVSPIEAKKWNAYKLEIVDAHKVRITLLKVGYTIQYDCNGDNVNGSMSPQTAYPYEPIQLSKNAFTRDNFSYRFWYASRNVNNTTLWYGYSEAGNNSTLGWYSNNEIKQYYAFSDASIVRFNLYNETVTMHARWAAKFTVSYVDENGSPAFDSWYNTVTYRSKADGKSYWLTPVSTRSTTGYFTNEMFNKISEYTFTSREIFYNYNTSSTAKGYQQFVFDYNINNGVSKSAKIEYDKIIHFNESGISPIENQRWNAYKLEIPNEHEVKITLYKLDYEVIYDANGGTGNMSTDKALPNTDYTVKTNAFTKSETVKNQVLSSKFRYWYAEDENHNWYGYTTAGDKSTLGWYSSDKIKEFYKVAEGEKLNLNKWGGSVTLHAQWLTPFLIDYVDNNYQPLFTDEDPVFKYWSMGMRIDYKNNLNKTAYDYSETWRSNVVYLDSDTQFNNVDKNGVISTKKLDGKIITETNTFGNVDYLMFISSKYNISYFAGEVYRDTYKVRYNSNNGLIEAGVYENGKFKREVDFKNNNYFNHCNFEVVSPYYLRVVLTPKTFTVNYDGNGGLGKMDSDTTRFGIPYNAKENGFFKPYESNFRCWYLYDNDTKMWYGYSKCGDESTLGWYQGQDLKQYYEVKENEQLPLGNKIEGSVTLYAQWFTPFTVSYVKNQYNAETGEYEKVPAFDKWNNYVFGSGLHSDKGSAVNSSFNDTDKPYMKFPFSQEYFYGGTQHAGYFGKTLKYSARIGRDRSTSYAGYVTILPFYYNTNTGVAEDQNPSYQCQNCYFCGMRNNMKEVDGHYYCPKCNYQFADNFYDTIIKFGNRAPTGFYAYEMSILNQNEIEITLYTKDELVDHYDVHYDKNSDEALGTMKSSHHYFDEPFTLDKCAFTRNGYNFRGWAVRDDATGNYLCYDVNGNKVWASEGKQVIVEDQCENVNFPILDVPENNGSITFVAQWQAGFNVHFITQYGAKAFTSWNSAVRYEDNTYSSLSRSTSPDTRYFATNDNIAVGAKFESYVCFGNTPDAALSPASLDNLNVVRFNYDAENGISMSDKQKYDTKIPIENCEDWTAYSVSINEITGDIYITLYEPPRELSINYYQPNANYTCGTTVIATFKVTNNTKYNYNPDDGIATMTVTMTGENGTDTPYQYGTYTKDFVIPARKSQNVYFKIPIPLDTATEHIRITANITYEGVVIAEYDITTNDGKSGYTTMTTVVGKMKTPEYGYNTKVPTNYKYLTADEVPSKRLANAASWDEYVYIGNGKYEKKTYYSLMRLDAGSTRPNAYCPVWWFNNDKNSKLDKPNFYKLMRSGYGLDVFYSSGFYTSDRIARLTNGVPCTDTNAFVPAQVSKIYYPENNYGAFALSDEFFDIYANRAKSDVSKDVLYDTVFASHYWNRVSNDWVASTEITGDQFNTASRTYFAKIKHMTPMWVKDGDYAVQPVATDAWTPAGMLSAGNVIDTTGIEGSMYDDWRWVSGQTK